MLASLMGLDEGIKNKEILASGGVPYYPYAERAIRALGIMLRFSQWTSSKLGKVKKFPAKTAVAKKIIENARNEGRQVYSLRIGIPYAFRICCPIPLLVDLFCLRF